MKVMCSFWKFGETNFRASFKYKNSQRVDKSNFKNNRIGCQVIRLPNSCSEIFMEIFQVCYLNFWEISIQLSYFGNL